jgi:branched-chain amino acid transport system permease protein
MGLRQILRDTRADLARSPAGGLWRRLPRFVRALTPVAILVALVASFPSYRATVADLPIVGTYVPGTGELVVMIIFTMMAVSLNVVVGYAGLLDLGYVAFYAIGAYAVAVFASTQFGGTNENPRTIRIGSVAPESLPGVHISVWGLLIFAAVLTAILGVVIGLPTLRLRGDYLAIVTLGFGEILPQVARNGDDLFGTGFNLTGGPSGITPVDALGFGQTLSDATGGILPATFQGSPEYKNKLYLWTAIGLLLLTVFCCVRLRDSRLGRAWVAIREDETAAAAMGIPLMRTKTWAYAVGAFFGGLAGGFFASFKSSAFESDFFFQISIFILCMVILGGMGNIWGVIVGALFLSYWDRFGIPTLGADINDRFGTNFDVPKYTFMIFGIILLVVMLFRPEGLFPEARRKAEIEEGVHDEPLYDVQHEGAEG